VLASQRGRKQRTVEESGSMEYAEEYERNLDGGWPYEDGDDAPEKVWF